MTVLYALLHHYHYTCNVSVHSAGSCGCYVLYLAMDVPLTRSNSNFIAILLQLLQLPELLKLQIIIIIMIIFTYRVLHIKFIKFIRVYQNLLKPSLVCSCFNPSASKVVILFRRDAFLFIVVKSSYLNNQKAFPSILPFPPSSTRHFCRENYRSLDVLIFSKLCRLLCVEKSRGISGF